MLKRGKQRYKVDFRIKDIYKDYKNNNPKDTPFFIDYRVYSDIIHAGFQKMSDLLLEGNKIALPYAMGELSIVKKKGNLKYPKKDYKTSKELGETIYFFNDHTRGYYYRFRWAKYKSLVKNKQYYCFIPTRYNKRKLAALIKQNKTDYFMI